MDVVAWLGTVEAPDKDALMSVLAILSVLPLGSLVKMVLNADLIQKKMNQPVYGGVLELTDSYQNKM